MKKSRKVGRLSLALMQLLLLSVLMACSLFKSAPPPVILQSSAPMRILPGDLPKSPAAKGWLLSDEATAKLLEKAESCK